MLKRNVNWQKPKEESQKQKASVGEYSTFQTIVDLWPYIWPTGRFDLKIRVVYSLLILIAAKVITVLVPYTYKWGNRCTDQP